MLGFEMISQATYYRQSHLSVQPSVLPFGGKAANAG